MQSGAVNGIITPSRSVSTLIGLEFAGTSGAQHLASTGSNVWHTFVNCLKAGNSSPRVLQTAVTQACSRHHMHTGARLQAKEYVFTRSTNPSHTSFSSHNTNRGMSCATKQRRSFRVQATPKAMWQRDYYSSGYGRAYSSYWDGDKVLYSLIAANCAGFLLWQSHPSLMRQHATVSVSSIREGRIHTLLTSAFSHASLSHLFTNMLTFYFFGREIGQTFGGKKVQQMELLPISAFTVSPCICRRKQDDQELLHLHCSYIAATLQLRCSYVAVTL